MSGAVQNILILLKLGMRKGFLPYIEISSLGIAFKLNLNLVDPIITGMATVWTFITLDSSSVSKEGKRGILWMSFGSNSNLMDVFFQ